MDDVSTCTDTLLRPCLVSICGVKTALVQVTSGVAGAPNWHSQTVPNLPHTCLRQHTNHLYSVAPFSVMRFHNSINLQGRMVRPMLDTYQLPTTYMHVSTQFLAQHALIQCTLSCTLRVCTERASARAHALWHPMRYMCMYLINKSMFIVWFI